MVTLWTFLLFSFPFLPFVFSESSIPKISYDEHCGRIVPEANGTHSLTVPGAFSLQGFHSGGASVFDESRHPLPRSFFFNPTALMATEIAGVIKVEAGLVLRGNKFQQSKMVSFFVQGYYSAAAEKLCAVGLTYFKSIQGKSDSYYTLQLKLNYPYASDIRSSMITGSLEIFNTYDRSDSFKPFYLLAYAQNSYEYRLIPEIKQNCLKSGAVEESVGPGQNGICDFLKNSLEEVPFKVEFPYPFDCMNKTCGPFQYNFPFMIIKYMNCSEDCSLRAVLEFSSIASSDFLNPLIPESTLVTEGFWDKEKNRLCLMACRILGTGSGSAEDVSVGDCTIGVSLWFPKVLSIRNPWPRVGRIWSNRDELDPLFFGTVKLRNPNIGYQDVPARKYKYTEMKMKEEHCVRSIAEGTTLSGYQSIKSFRSMIFRMALVGPEGESAYSYATPLTVGEVFYNNMKRDSSLLVEPDRSTWNVSYEMQINLHSGSSYEFHKMDITAEGLYDTENGKLCMVGCRYIAFSISEKGKENVNDFDCKIQFDLQLLSKTGKWHLDGTMVSRREKSDPFYFESFNIMSPEKHSEKVSESTIRLNMRATVIVISFVIYYVSIGKQLAHLKKHPDVLSCMSHTMLILQSTGILYDFELSYESLLFMISRGQDVMLQGYEWFDRLSRFYYSARGHSNLLDDVTWIQLNQFLLLMTFFAALLTSRSLLSTVRSVIFDDKSSSQEERPNDTGRKNWWLAKLKIRVDWFPLIGILLLAFLCEIAFVSLHYFQVVFLVATYYVGLGLVRAIQFARTEEPEEKKQKARMLIMQITCFPMYMTAAFFAYSFYKGIIVRRAIQNNPILLACTSFMIDGFLLPQIMLNFYLNIDAKPLTPIFFIGTTISRALPHVYDFYRPCRYSPYAKLSSKYKTADWDFSSSVWDYVIPCGSALLALIIHLQQQFGCRLIFRSKLNKKTS